MKTGPARAGARRGGDQPLIRRRARVALIAGALAAQNGAARMLFALGRDGLLPRALGRTTRRFGAPAAALTVVLVAAIAMGLGFGFGFQPLPAFSLLSLVVTLCALGVYALAQFGLARYFWRLGRFNPLWHGLIPAAAVAAIVYLFLKNVSPKLPYPPTSRSGSRSDGWPRESSSWPGW